MGTILSRAQNNVGGHFVTATGTAIITMEIGQKVWVETQFNLFSDQNAGYIHFTGVLLSPK